jgi:branched-subunit amino acid aminotransferase/4-amino-4-deoxychorismate lyase
MSVDTVVADSFLVDHGRVLWLEAHADRFARDAGAEGFPADEARAALLNLARSVPHTGRWFPRIDLLADGTLMTRPRPAPPRGGPVSVATAGRDPRTRPAVKGPDLEALAAERARAQQLGADEALLLVDGLVCDGALSAVVWWRDEVLHLPDPALTRVDSVTTRWLLAEARARGFEVRRVRARPDDLAGAEVWVLGALHGIRPVMRWLGGPMLASDSDRPPLWQARLESARTPISCPRTDGRALPG